MDATVPEDLELNVYSKFGMVEVHEIQELTVDAEFGGVDLTVERFELNASTAGTIFSNLDDELNGGDVQRHDCSIDFEEENDVLQNKFWECLHQKAVV